ncbi:hypothetical protein [Streptomyces sp. NPDC001530]|uniref:hypothetical protein n=1 Tax=Streptomyces sp. NPDC001530 TaxID=3364582 RepID=UPI0036CD8EB7
MGYEEDGQRYVSLAGLRVRGWSGAIVHRLLGPPDRLGVNPRFRSAPYTRLYRAERVEAAERSEEFRAVAETAVRRPREVRGSEAVRAEIARRREAVLEQIRVEPIEVPHLDPGKLALRAVEHRARREMERGRRAPAQADTDTDTDTNAGAGECTGRASLDLWKVDYLCHRLTHYDRLLDRLPGPERSTERAEAAALLRRRTYAAIAEAYLALAQECTRQLREQGLGPPPW